VIVATDFSVPSVGLPYGDCQKVGVVIIADHVTGIILFRPLTRRLFGLLVCLPHPEETWINPTIDHHRKTVLMSF